MYKIGLIRRSAIIMLTVILSMSFVYKVYANEENSTNLKLYARAAVLMDADSGRVLYEKNGMEKMPMASTTKIMTCIIALEYGNPEDMVEVSAYAAKMPKVKLYMKKGEYYRMEDLLYSLMLESHNDSAVAIAEHIAGSVEAFADMMNQKAKDIECYDTFFITPNGLDAATTDGTRVHSTTARDLAAIMSYCINDSPMKEEFLHITGVSSYQFTNFSKKQAEEEYQTGGRNFSISNHNAFLTMMEGALSGKTGFTNNAGYCYVGSLRRGERTYVVALLACGWPNNKSYKWSDTRVLINYGLENYEYRDIFELPALERVPVEGGIPGSQRPYGTAYADLEVQTGGENSLPYLLREDETVSIRVNIPVQFKAPTVQGDPVGNLQYVLNGEIIKEYPIIFSDTVNKISFMWVAKYLFRLYCLP